MVYTDDFPPSASLLAFFKQLIDRIMTEVSRTNKDMTLNQIELVVILGRKMTMKEVADSLIMHPSNVTGLVKTCNERGWIKRIDSKTDKRTKFLTLTQAGIDLRQRLLKDLNELIHKETGIDDEIASNIMSHLRHLQTA